MYRAGEMRRNLRKKNKDSNINRDLQETLQKKEKERQSILKEENQRRKVT